MGYKHDQRLPSEIHEEVLEAQRVSSEEPLPPYIEVPNDLDPGSLEPSGPNESLTPSSMSDTILHPTSSFYAGPTFDGTDHRRSSQESITSRPIDDESRRILLLVYIHGFVGDETSFASFPAHIHSMLSRRVSATHAVHTKIFPRYKTRRNISVVRDHFSAWLTQREGPRTDIILLGHSMGGILAAEVALMAGSGHLNLKHRLLGTLNLDVPFLGMHPKVIGAGLTSLFAGTPEKSSSDMGSDDRVGSVMDQIAIMPIEPTQSYASVSSSHIPSTLSPVFSGTHSGLEMPAHNDQYFNPGYTDDRRVPTRTTFDSISHFVSKHAMSDGLLKAGASYVTSHLEFGGTMADYKRLDKRYTLLRSLEKEERGGVHFVNYFTICEGRPKKIKPRKAGTGDELEVDQDGDLRSDALGNPLDQETLSEEADEPSGEGMQSLTLTSTDPIPASDTESEGNYTPSISGSYKDAQDYLNAKEPEEDEPGSDPEGDTGGMHHLPPVPAEPVAPPAFDASKYSEKDALKLAEKHYSRQLKAYQQAFKGREKVIKERENLIRKREEKRRRDEQRALQRAEKGAIKLAKAQLREDAKKEQRRRAEEKATEKASQKKFKQLEKEASKEKQESEKAEKIRLKEEKKRAKEASTANVDVGQEDDNGGERGDLKILKKRKLKTFCMTPPKAASARRKDWIPVFVADVDQVGAHCGLFQVDKPHYEPFVGRVVEKIESWVDSISETTLA